MELLLSDSSRANLAAGRGEPDRGRARVPGRVAVLVRRRPAWQRRRVRLERGAQRLPHLRDRPGRRLLCRLCARSASWAARSGCCTPPGPTASRSTASASPSSRRSRLRRGADRHGPRLRENPAAGLDRRAHRARQPPQRRDAAARARRAQRARSRSSSPTSTTSSSSTTPTATRPGTARCGCSRRSPRRRCATTTSSRPLGRRGVHHRAPRARPRPGRQRGRPPADEARRRTPARRPASPPPSASLTPTRPRASRSSSRSPTWGSTRPRTAGRDCAMVGETDGPAPQPRQASAKPERRATRPPIQEASYEEDPAPNGAQIR